MEKEIQTWRSQKPEDTVAFAHKLSTLFQPGDIILLEGDLGSGKTFFVQNICPKWGIEQTITSPTFTLMHHYYGLQTVNHLDLYRIEAAEELYNLGWEEAVYSDAISFIEWPQLLEPQLDNYYKITIRFENEYRHFTLFKISPSL